MAVLAFARGLLLFGGLSLIFCWPEETSSHMLQHLQGVRSESFAKCVDSWRGKPWLFRLHCLADKALSAGISKR